MNITYIDSICTTNTKRVFNIKVNNTISTYVADIEQQQNNTLDYNNTYGKGNISTDIGIINNLYAIDKFFMKSASKIGSGTTTYNYVNVFSHRISTLKSITQVDNAIYGITPYDNFAHYKLNEDIYSYISSNTDHILPDDTYISTLIFNKNEILKGNFDTAINTNIEQVQYNKLVEIPGNEFNDYDSGNYIGNVFNMKNHYSSIYNMEHTSTQILKNARQYIGIGNFNSTVYLKYYDNIDYTINGGNTRLNENSNKQLKYQHIEVVGALNRKFSNIQHKTQLYSLNINTKVNDELINKSNTLSVIQMQIKNNVDTYLKKLAPANTQIFKINIENTL